MASVEDRIAVLEALVGELRAQLERPPRRDSMSKTLTCPCCGGGSFIGLREIKEHTHGGLVPLAIGNKATFWTSKQGAPLQAYICKACKLVEFHVALIEQLVPDGKMIIEIERPADPDPAPDAPYR